MKHVTSAITSVVKYFNRICFSTATLICLISLFLRYAHGPVPLQSQQYTTSQDIINSVSYIQQEMANYKPNLTQVGLSSSTLFGPLMVNTSVTKAT